MKGLELARAAQALCGTPFRLQGRDPASGLDCLGVLAAAFAACGRTVSLPAGYALRSSGASDVAAWARGCGLAPASGAAEPGDVMLVACSPVQLHLLVATSGGRFVHAHAGLRRVVVGACDPAWTIAGHWRLADPEE